MSVAKILCLIALVVTQILCEEESDFTKADCVQPHTATPNMCLAYIERYHWNNSKQKCEKVVYGGCRATRNNFRTLQSCQKIAGSICTA